MVHDEEQAIECSIEDEGAEGGYLRLVQAVFFPERAELVDVRLEVTPVPENALGKLLEECIVATRKTFMSIH